MKRVFIALALLQIGGIAQAQFQFTSHAGVAIQKGSGDLSAGVGAQIGVDVRYSFNGQDTGWALQSGLYYQQRMTSYWGALCYSYKVPEGFWGFTSLPAIAGPGFPAHDYLMSDYDIQSIASYAAKFRDDYLQLPIMAQYAWELAPDIRLHISAGGYVGYQITGKYKQGTAQIDAEDLTHIEYTKQKARTHSHEWDMGFISQAGLEVKRFTFLVNYQTNLFHRTRNGAYNLASFSVGYAF